MLTERIRRAEMPALVLASIVPVAVVVAWLVDRIDATQASVPARAGQLSLGPAAYLVLSLAPGIAATTFLRSRDVVTSLAVLLGASGLVGAVTFWVWFASPSGGRWWSAAVLLGASLVLIVRRRWLPPAPVVAAVALAGLIATLAVSVTAFDAATGRGVNAAAVNQSLWPVEDNRLPEYFADRLIEGPPLNEVPLHGDWLSSDRPPLQTGLYLVVEPFTGLGDVAYQLHGVAVQVWWVTGVVALLLAIGISVRRSAATVALVAMSGLVFLNTVYVRPGMLSAGLVIMALAVLLTPSAPITLAGIFAGLAFLAHGSTLVLFATMLPLAVSRLRAGGWTRGVAQAGAGVAVVALCAVPWLMYQRYYDPPGDRLTKYYLAGVTAASDERSLLEAISDRYRELSAGEIVEHKVSNVASYVRGEPGVPSWAPTDGVLRRLQWLQLFTVVGALGFLIVGAPQAAADGRRSRASRWSWLVTGATMFLTALLHFGSWSTQPIPHKLGFTPVLIAAALLSAGLLSGPRWLRWPVLGAHVAGFVSLWVIAPHVRPAFSDPIPGIDLVAVTVAVGAAAAIVWSIHGTRRDVVAALPVDTRSDRVVRPATASGRAGPDR